MHGQGIKLNNQMAKTRAHNTKHLTGTRSLMLHSLGFVTGDPSIRIGYPYVFHPGLQITVNEAGDSKWIYLMLPVDKGSLITDIKVAHHRTGFQSRVTLLRLVEQCEPVTAMVVHDETIEKTIPSTCVISSACQVVVNHSVLLKVCMKFANTDDMIEFGSVEICYIPDYVSLSERKKKDKGASKQSMVSAETYLFNGDYSLNAHRPTLAELFMKKRRKENQFLE